MKQKLDINTHTKTKTKATKSSNRSVAFSILWWSQESPSWNAIPYLFPNSPIDWEEACGTWWMDTCQHQRLKCTILNGKGHSQSRARNRGAGCIAILAQSDIAQFRSDDSMCSTSLKMTPGQKYCARSRFRYRDPQCPCALKMTPGQNNGPRLAFDIVTRRALAR